MKTANTFLFFIFFALHLNGQVPAGKQVTSSLYVYSLETGLSELVLREKRHFEAPNWSHDGKKFAYVKYELEDKK